MVAPSLDPHQGCPLLFSLPHESHSSKLIRKHSQQFLLQFILQLTIFLVTDYVNPRAMKVFVSPFLAMFDHVANLAPARPHFLQSHRNPPSLLFNGGDS